MYHIQNDSKLRVCGRYIRQTRNREVFQNTRFIILQHILKDTEELLQLLHDSTAEIFSIICKPYSVDPDVLSRLSSKFANIINSSYAALEETPVLYDLLKEAIVKSKEDKKRIIIIEVGGYFAEPLSKLASDEIEYIAGVIEDTTFGHNRYNKLIGAIKIPVYSVARSPLKKIEARFVGDSAVSAVTELFRSNGSTISSRNALVIGYGMIGQNVAHSLRAKNLSVNVYDKDDYKNLSAFSKGYGIHKKIELLKNADIIFSATGTNALSLEDIENCKSGCVLVSVGSKDIEFDVQGLRNLAFKVENVGEKHIERFHLPSGRKIVLIKEGTAVNFLIKSVPDEVIDLVFAEIIICAVILLKGKGEHRLNEINLTPSTYLNEISKDWLKDINR